MNILEGYKIHKSYGNKFTKQHVLMGIDMSIEKGEFVFAAGNFLSVDRNGPVTHTIDGREDVQQGRFAGTGRAHNADKFPFFYTHINSHQHMLFRKLVAVAFVNFVSF
jgi:ABC-type polar amino acid transport system ATPase subunit